MKKQNHLYWGNIPNKPGANRPYLVLSTDEANTINVVVAPIRSNQSKYITNVALSKDNYPFKKDSSIDLSQIITMESKYLDKEICILRDEDCKQVKEVLRELLSL